MATNSLFYCKNKYAAGKCAVLDRDNQQWIATAMATGVAAHALCSVTEASVVLNVGAIVKHSTHVGSYLSKTLNLAMSTMERLQAAEALLNEILNSTNSSQGKSTIKPLPRQPLTTQAFHRMHTIANVRTAITRYENPRIYTD